jgi:hypothetical protein
VNCVLKNGIGCSTSVGMMRIIARRIHAEEDGERQQDLHRVDSRAAEKRKRAKQRQQQGYWELQPHANYKQKRRRPKQERRDQGSDSDEERSRQESRRLSRSSRYKGEMNEQELARKGSRRSVNAVDHDPYNYTISPCFLCNPDDENDKHTIRECPKLAQAQAALGRPVIKPPPYILYPDRVGLAVKRHPATTRGPGPVVKCPSSKAVGRNKH